MALIKCKMCGGDLKITEGSTVCECEYCGTKQTVPKLDDEKKLKLFERANRLRAQCEFDKAAGVYETIVADFPEEAEAYWGLVLCKYGIEYVDDPATGKKIPTCHRSSFDNVLKDANFEQACEYTDAIARRVYRDEARAIEELRRGILEVSGREEPYDVFISYKEKDENGERTPDSVIAQDIYRELTREGYRVFFSRISLENRLGTEYEPYIFAALNSAKVMIVVGTDYDNFDAVWVKNEWSRFLKLIAAGQKKTLIPVFKNMDAYDMPEEFNKLTALDMGKLGAMQDLLRGVEKLINKKSAPAKETVKETVVVQQSGGPNVTALLTRGRQALEDEDWEKAAGFFDQVLSMDAENAEAFFGLFLADTECSNEQEYIDAVCAQEAAVETLSISPDNERVEAAVRQYAINGYLSESKIQSLFEYDLSYPSTLKAWQTISEQTEKLFKTDRNLIRAVRYAKDDPAARPMRFKAALSDALEKTVSAAEEQEKAAEENKRQTYSAFLAAAEKKAAGLKTEAEARREADYQDDIHRFEQATRYSDYQFVKAAFQTLVPYKDSAKMITRCDEKMAQIKKAEAEEAERQRIAKEKAENAARAKKTRRTIAAILAAVLVAAGYFIYTKVIFSPRQYAAAEALLAGGDTAHAAMAFGSAGNYKDARTRSLALWEQIAQRNAVAAGACHTVGLRSDGTVVAAGSNSDGQCWVSGWTDIVAVAAGACHTVGLRSDGMVVAVGSNHYGRCNVSGWTDIVAVAAGVYHTVGRRSDGTVVAVGDNGYGRCKVSGWTDIVAVAAGDAHTVGLRSDGTVVSAGNNSSSQRSVSGWTDIVAVAAGDYHTVGLRSDGTVIAVGKNNFGQCKVSGWTDIVAVAAGWKHTVGLRSDGTVVSVGSNYYGQGDVSGWTDIVAVAAGDDHTVGLRSDGTVVAVGRNLHGQGDVSGWTDIKLPNT